jgi:hypothetical protein
MSFPSLRFKVSSRSLGLATLSLSILGGVACTTIQTAPQRGSSTVDLNTAMPVLSGHRSADAGVLISYEFTGRAEDDTADCRLRLINKDTGSSLFVPITANDHAAYVELEQGAYELGRMGCGVGRVWEMNDTYKDGFHVASGDTSYLGKVIFIFKDGNLDEVQKASRMDSAKAFNDAAALARDSGTTIVSAFTLEPITADMTNDPAARDLASVGANANDFAVHIDGIKEVQNMVDPLLTKLKNCDHQAASRDPLRFGHIDYTAVYESGQFANFKDRIDKNAFSQGFRECIAGSLSEFHVNQKDHVEIQVVY